MARASADVVVVGAGPAGSAAALQLARAGHGVLLLERARFPRPKACGDCLSAAATTLLEQLGVLADIEAAAPARLAGWRIHSPSGDCFEGRFDPHGAAPSPTTTTALALSRERLDPLLARAAARAGAVLAEGVHVTDLLRDASGAVTGVVAREEDGHAYEIGARLVVGADGLRSVVARRLGLVRRLPRLRKLSLTAHVHGVSGVGPYGEMHVVRGACAGLAPVESGPDPLCNLTLVVGAAGAGERPGDDHEAFFRATLQRFPALRARLRRLALQPHTGGALLLASGPFDWEMRRAVAPGAALAGDAAGYYDPFTGQGIFQALQSALLLAEDAEQALHEHARGGRAPLLREYARERARRTAGPRALQRLIEAVLSRPRLADAAIARLRGARALADALVAVTGDLRPPGTLLSPRLLFSLLAPRTTRELPA